MGILPPLAALAAIVWYALQIWESKTIRRHVRLKRMLRRKKRIARNLATVLRSTEAAEAATLLAVQQARAVALKVTPDDRQQPPAGSAN